MSVADEPYRCDEGGHIWESRHDRSGWIFFACCYCGELKHSVDLPHARKKEETFEG